MHNYLSDPDWVSVEEMSCFETAPADRVVLDDTDALSCNIESHQRNEDHIEYIISVKRGCRSSKDRWRVQHRFRDFIALHDALSAAKLDVQLPPKKVFGNMEKDFVEDRRQGLQVYLDTLLSHPVLSQSLPVKRFLDPPNYPSTMEAHAIQAVQMALRGCSLLSAGDTLPALGWRVRKLHMSSTDGSGRRMLLSWAPYGPDRCLSLPQLNQVVKCLATIQCPYIQPHEYSRLVPLSGLYVTAFCPSGALRDVIHGSRPGSAHFLSKLVAGGGQHQCSLLYQDIRNISRQILEALRLLHDRGIPYGQLHSGNVLYDGGVCRLCDIENPVWGLPPLYRPYLVRHKRLLTTDAADVYSFGHVLYELTFGRPLLAECVESLPDDLMPDLAGMLRSLLSAEALHAGLPSVRQLLDTPMFRDVVPPLPVSFTYRVTAQARDAFKVVKSTIEQRLAADHKLYRRQRRFEKTETLLHDVEGRRVRQRHRYRIASKSTEVSESGSSESVTGSTGSSLRSPQSPVNSTSAPESSPALGEVPGATGRGTGTSSAEAVGSKETSTGAAGGSTSPPPGSSGQPDPPHRSSSGQPDRLAVLDSMAMFNKDKLKQVNLKSD